MQYWQDLKNHDRGLLTANFVDFKIWKHFETKTSSVLLHKENVLLNMTFQNSHL